MHWILPMEHWLLLTEHRLEYCTDGNPSQESNEEAVPPGIPHAREKKK